MLDGLLGYVTFEMKGMPNDQTKNAYRSLTLTGIKVEPTLNGTQVHIAVYSKRGLERIRRVMQESEMQEIPCTISGL